MPVTAIRDTASQDIARPTTARSRWQRARRWAPLLALPLVALAAWPLFSRWSAAERSVERASLRIATVERGHFVSDVIVQGRAVAAVSPTLYAGAAGVVTLSVAAGEAVTKGQVLATVDSPEVGNELARERVNLASLRSAVERQRVEARTKQSQGRMAIELAGVSTVAAQRELARAKDAVGRGVMPAIEAARRTDELTVAEVHERHTEEEMKLVAQGLDFELRTRQQEAERQALLVDNLQRRADELVVRAPVSGVVGTVAIAQKAAVAANQPLLSVVDLSALEVEIQVPETYAQSIGIGMAVDVSWGESRHRGKLTALSPEVQNGQVVARVRFDAGTPPELRQNQRVSVRILLDERDNVLMVQRGPWVEAGGGRNAYVVQGDVATRTPVRIGATSISSVEILEGLSPGDQIVTSGTDEFAKANTLYLHH